MSEVDQIIADSLALARDAAAEALTNVARHAGQATAILTGELAAGRLRLQITDTGTGFDPATVPAGPAGALCLLHI